MTEFLGRARYERADGGGAVIYRNGLRADDGEDDQRRRWCWSARGSATPASSGSRAEVARQGRGPHARAGGAGDLLLPARPVGARRRGGAGGDASTSRSSRKSTVARICEDARALPRLVRARAGRARPRLPVPGRDLPEAAPDDEPAEGVLVAWGVTLEGRKVLLGLQLGSRESYEDWLDFGRDLIARGMRAPALDRRRRRAGALEGRPRAVASRARAALHRPRAAQRHRQAARAPAPRAQGALLADPRRGRRSAAEAKAGLLALVADYRAAYPSAMAVIERDLDALVAHLRFPSSTASGSAPRTCSSARSSRSAGAPR